MVVLFSIIIRSSIKEELDRQIEFANHSAENDFEIKYDNERKRLESNQSFTILEEKDEKIEEKNIHSMDEILETLEPNCDK